MRGVTASGAPVKCSTASNVFTYWAAQSKVCKADGTTCRAFGFVCAAQSEANFSRIYCHQGNAEVVATPGVYD